MQKHSSVTAILGLSVCMLIYSCARPIADFQIPNESMAPAVVAFDNHSKKAVTYSWDFGDGHQSIDADPTHRYLHSGNYEIILRATNEKGKSSTKSKRIMIEPPKNCMVLISTDYGDMIVELDDRTPKHRDNFYHLADEGFYDGLLFHRVIKDFMIQGGDPESRHAEAGQSLGTGGPGYQIVAEFHPELTHIKGALAAARMGDQVNPARQSSGSQFYIVQGRPVTEAELKEIEHRNGISYAPDQIKAYEEQGGTPFLDGQYTVFGHVIEGLDVLDKIASVASDNRNRPLQDVKMKITTIK